MYKIGLFVFVVVFCVISVSSQTSQTPPNYGMQFDEIVVEQSLNIRKKPQPVRQTRNVVLAPLDRLEKLIRFKRQQIGLGRQGGFGGFGGGFNPYSSSSALANANSQGQHFGPNGFGGSAGSAQGQAFNSQGPLGSFGAAASGAQTQGFEVGPDGFRGSAGLSGSQSYNLPNGHSINLSFTNGYSVGPDGKPAIANGNSIAYT